MPEPSLFLLAKLFGIKPPDIPMTPEQRAMYDKIVREQQSKDSPYKQTARKGFENILDFTGGLFGGEGEELGPTPRNTGALLSAGLPFASYAAAKLPYGKVFHGTQKLFDKFDPSKYDTSDVLGWASHFAERPEYSSSYAMGRHKGVKSINEELRGPITAKELTGPRGEKLSPHVIPAKIEAQNVLDLIHPNADDISQILASVPEYDRQYLISQFKRARSMVREAPSNMSTRALASQLGIKDAHLRAIGDIERRDIPLQVLAERIRLTPEQMKRSPFDAIRYTDMSEKAWAIPPGTPILSHYGDVPLTQNPKPLKVFRRDEPLGGELTLNPDRWMYTPMSTPDSPHPEKYKSVWEPEVDLEADMFELDPLFESFANTGITEPVLPSTKPQPKSPISSLANDPEFTLDDAVKFFGGYPSYTVKNLLDKNPGYKAKDIKTWLNTYVLGKNEKQWLENKMAEMLQAGK